jgi:hypothetical protein
MSEGCECRQVLIDGMARLGAEVVVSTAPPLAPNPFTEEFVCPHRTRWFMEPTGEQYAQWAEDGRP